MFFLSTVVFHTKIPNFYVQFGDPVASWCSDAGQETNGGPHQTPVADFAVELLGLSLDILVKEWCLATGDTRYQDFETQTTIQQL